MGHLLSQYTLTEAKCINSVQCHAKYFIETVSFNFYDLLVNYDLHFSSEKNNSQVNGNYKINLINSLILKPMHLTTIHYLLILKINHIS